MPVFLRYVSDTFGITPDGSQAAGQDESSELQYAFTGIAPGLVRKVRQVSVTSWSGSRAAGAGTTPYASDTIDIYAEDY